jgi:hypothetical protein
VLIDFTGIPKRHSENAVMVLPAYSWAFPEFPNPICRGAILGLGCGSLEPENPTTLEEPLFPILIELKLRQWCGLAKYPNPACPASRARRNFWRLCEAHPDTAKRLGYTLQERCKSLAGIVPKVSRDFVVPLGVANGAPAKCALMLAASEFLR